MSITIYPDYMADRCHPEVQDKTVYLQPKGVWMQDGKEYLRHYVDEELLKPLATYIRMQAQKAQEIEYATEKKAGVVCLASTEDVAQGLNNTDVITPRQGRVRFYSRSDFEKYLSVFYADLDTRGGKSEKEILQKHTETLNVLLDVLSNSLDKLNGREI